MLVSFNIHNACQYGNCLHHYSTIVMIIIIFFFVTVAVYQYVSLVLSLLIIIVMIVIVIVNMSFWFVVVVGGRPEHLHIQHAIWSPSGPADNESAGVAQDSVAAFKVTMCKHQCMAQAGTGAWAHNGSRFD